MKKKTPFIEELMILFMKIVAIVILLIVLWVFLFGITRCTDNSMAPAVHEGDLILYYRIDKEYVATDLVALEYEEETQIRRVIAIAGDEVDIDEEGLYINGSLQQEPNITEDTLRYDIGVIFPLIVPEGDIFVLADARENGTDSRVYGTVPAKETLGKVITIIRRRGF